MTDKTDKTLVTGRRDFLKVLGGTSALAATSVAATLPAEAQQESKDERLKAGTRKQTTSSLSTRPTVTEDHPC